MEREVAKHLLPPCPDCDGSGWTVWAALATEPWTEIIPGLWVGGHDYNISRTGGQDIVSEIPSGFDLTVSLFSRPGFEPTEGRHLVYRFEDERGALNTGSTLETVMRAAAEVTFAVEHGQRVLSRCQAGLNRSSLVAGIAMVALGYEGVDAVQLIRARRSPWALCNADFEGFLRSLSADSIRLHSNTNKQGPTP